MGAMPYVSWRGVVGTLAVLVFTQFVGVRAVRAGSAAPDWLPPERRRERG